MKATRKLYIKSLVWGIFCFLFGWTSIIATIIATNFSEQNRILFIGIAISAFCLFLLFFALFKNVSNRAEEIENNKPLCDFIDSMNTK